MTDKAYPELPKAHLPRGGFPDLYTADQMRAYVDADRAMRATKAAPQPAENTWAQLDAMRSELATDIREVFDANGPETPQIVRDVIEYADSWLQACIQRKAENAPAAQPPAGIWVPTELAERVQETMGEFLMDHGWRQQDMDTSDEFGALLAVATKAEPAPPG